MRPNLLNLERKLALPCPGKRSGTPPGKETMEYVHQLAGELALLATGADARLVAWFLAMAEEEARALAAEHKLAA